MLGLLWHKEKLRGIKLIKCSNYLGLSRIKRNLRGQSVIFRKHFHAIYVKLKILQLKQKLLPFISQASAISNNNYIHFIIQTSSSNQKLLTKSKHEILFAKLRWQNLIWSTTQEGKETAARFFFWQPQTKQPAGFYC